MLTKKIEKKPLRFTTARVFKRLPRFKKTVQALFAYTPKAHLQNSRLTGVLSHPRSAIFPALRSSFPKALFHIKCLFELEEFATYDYFNFQKTSAPIKKPKTSHSIVNAPVRLNFFYRIRTSIKIFRMHTLMFFRRSHKTEHRTNLFFKTFSSMSTLAYMWFFEFNLAVFLVKVGFCSSLLVGNALVATDCCFVNGATGHSRWSLVKPGDLVQLPFGGFFLWWLINSLHHKLNITRRYSKLMVKLFFKRSPAALSPLKRKKALSLTWSKQKPFHLIEIDPKTASAFLLPYKNNHIYFKLTFTMWLNYWNYRVTLWKYRT